MMKHYFISIYKHNLHCQRSYLDESTSTHSTTEVKHRRARIVLGWVTAWELFVALTFCLFIATSHITSCNKHSLKFYFNKLNLILCSSHLTHTLQSFLARNTTFFFLHTHFIIYQNHKTFTHTCYPIHKQLRQHTNYPKINTNPNTNIKRNTHPSNLLPSSRSWVIPKLNLLHCFMGHFTCHRLFAFSVRSLFGEVAIHCMVRDPGPYDLLILSARESYIQIKNKTLFLATC